VRIGEMPDSDLRVRRLGELRRVTFGAPAYFAKHGRPRHPNDLAKHQCVVRAFDGNSEKWPFQIDGKLKTVKVSGRFRADNTAAIHSAVTLGLGIGFTPLWQIRDLLDRGAVELILVKFETPRVPIRAVWPATKIPLAKSQLFVDFLGAHLDCDRF
jgi:DNA-binding transcriptional LysR family regulator